MFYCVLTQEGGKFDKSLEVEHGNIGLYGPIMETFSYAIAVDSGFNKAY